MNNMEWVLVAVFAWVLWLIWTGQGLIARNRRRIDELFRRVEEDRKERGR